MPIESQLVSPVPVLGPVSAHCPQRRSVCGGDLSEVRRKFCCLNLTYSWKLRSSISLSLAAPRGSYRSPAAPSGQKVSLSAEFAESLFTSSSIAGIESCFSRKGFLWTMSFIKLVCASARVHPLTSIYCDFWWRNKSIESGGCAVESTLPAEFVV